MNLSMKSIDSKKALLVVGQESHSQMFIMSPKVGQLPPSHIPTKESTASNRRDSSSELRQRKQQQHGKNRERTESVGSESSLPDNSASPSQLKRVFFDIKVADSIQTDFLLPEPLQRVIRICPSGSFMATGGLDGHVRVWNFPQMTPHVDIPAHKKELDDLDFSPDGKHLLSVSKDGQAIVFSPKSGKELFKLQWTPPEGVKYLFKRCRYATVEGAKEKYRLFTISNPLGKTSKAKGFLQQWNVETGRLNNIVEIDESLSALAVRDDGRFVAVGTMFSGSVEMFIAYSLKKVLRVQGAHSMFVTGLEFIPVLTKEKDAPPISSDVEASVVSYSVDNRICIHSLQYRRELDVIEQVRSENLQQILVSFQQLSQPGSPSF